MAADRPSPPFVLRAPRYEDAALYSIFMADPEVTIWLEDRCQRPILFHHALAFVLGEAWCRLAIEVEGRFVGMTGLEEPDLSRGIARFFIVIGDRTMWKKGLGTAVARRVVEQGFRHLGLRKIVSNYFEPNVASRTVHQRVGFIDEGRLRQEAWRRGSWVDLLLVSILREQWVMESAAGALTAGASLVYSSPRNGSGSHAIRIARHGPHRRGPYRFDRGF